MITILTGLLTAGRLALWPIWLTVRGLLTTNGFLAALVVGGAVMFYTYDQSRVQSGVNKEAARRDKANDTAVSVARKGASGSLSGSNGRVLDPHVRALE